MSHFITLVCMATLAASHAFAASVEAELYQDAQPQPQLRQTVNSKQKQKRFKAKKVVKANSRNKSQVARVQKNAPLHRSRPVTHNELSEFGGPETVGTLGEMPEAPVLAARLNTQENPKHIAPHFGLNWRSQNSLNMHALENTGNNADGEVQAWERIRFQYSWDDDVQYFGIMPQFYHTWFGDPDRPQIRGAYGLSQPYAGYSGNTSLIYHNDKLIDWGNGYASELLLQYDLPTGEQAQQADEIGETWTQLFVKKSFGPLDLKVSGMLHYYFQQYTTSNVYTMVNGQKMENLLPEYQFYTLLDVAWNITKKLSLNLETGFINENDYGDPYTGRPEISKMMTEMNPEIDYSFTKNFALALGIYEQPDMLNYSSPQYLPLEPDNDGQIYLMSTVQF